MKIKYNHILDIHMIMSIGEAWVLRGKSVSLVEFPLSDMLALFFSQLLIVDLSLIREEFILLWVPSSKWREVTGRFPQEMHYAKQCVDMSMPTLEKVYARNHINHYCNEITFMI